MNWRPYEGPLPKCVEAIVGDDHYVVRRHKCEGMHYTIQVGFAANAEVLPYKIESIEVAKDQCEALAAPKH